MIYEKIIKMVELCNEDITRFEEIISMDFVDIFPTSEEDRDYLDDEASNMGRIIEKTSRGNFYRLYNPIDTVLGKIEIIKIRKFDKTRLGYIGAGDFVVDDFEDFKEKYKSHPNCRYVEAETYSAIEIKTDNTLAYVMDIPTSIYYKDK